MLISSLSFTWKQVFLWNDRIIKKPGLEKDLTDHPTPACLSWTGALSTEIMEYLDHVAQSTSLSWNPSRDGSLLRATWSHVSLPSQWRISSYYVIQTYSLSVWSLSCPVTTCPFKLSFSRSPVSSFRVLEGCNLVTLKSLLFQADQFQSSQHLLIHPAIFLTLLQQVEILHVLRIQSWLQHSRCGLFFSNAGFFYLELLCKIIFKGEKTHDWILFSSTFNPLVWH